MFLFAIQKLVFLNVTFNFLKNENNISQLTNDIGGG